MSKRRITSINTFNYRVNRILPKDTYHTVDIKISEGPLHKKEYAYVIYYHLPEGHPGVIIQRRTIEEALESLKELITSPKQPQL